MQKLISIVDDDDIVRASTLDLVMSMGFAARAFSGAQELLDSDDLDRTFCLIADMRMPEMTGLELHSRLKKSGKSIITILITAFPDERDRMRAMRLGVKCYLPKPFNDEELLRCVRSALA